MKIWIYNDDGELGIAGHGRDGPSNFTPIPMRTQNVLSFVQGTHARPKDSGNLYMVWTFSVSREHASIAAAEDYLLGLGESVPGQADVYIELNDQQTRYKLADCCIKVQPAAPIGRRTVVTYTLTYAQRSTANLITNGDFSDGVTGWTLEAADPAVGTISVVDGALKVDITATSSNDWALRAAQDASGLAAGRTYQLRCRLKADAPRTVRVEIYDTAGSASLFSGSYNLTTDWLEINETFGGADAATWSVYFHGATELTDYYIDDVRVERITD